MQAYQLELPPHLKIHNVFHVSLLKKYILDPQHVLKDNNISFVSQEEILAEQEEMLQIEEKQLRNRRIRKVLVRWKGFPIEDASWEDWDQLLKQFPYLTS